MMIHISRDGEQFGPYTLDDANMYLEMGTLLPTDQAWYEGAPDWMPLPVVMAKAGYRTAPVAVAPEIAATAGKKKIMTIAGSTVGVLAIAGVLCFVYPGFLKKESAAETGASSFAKQKDTSSPTQDESGSMSFAKTVEPIFRKYGCYKCHNSKESNKVEADLDFSVRSSLKPFLAPNQKGNPATTPLILALTATDADGRPMPPKGPRVSDPEVETIEQWIVSEWGE